MAVSQGAAYHRPDPRHSTYLQLGFLALGLGSGSGLAMNVFTARGRNDVHRLAPCLRQCLVGCILHRVANVRVNGQVAGLPEQLRVNSVHVQFMFARVRRRRRSRG